MKQYSIVGLLFTETLGGAVFVVKTLNYADSRRLSGFLFTILFLDE